MSGKKRGPKPRYEEEDVLEAMAVYFYEHMVVRKEDLSVFTMDAIYDDIQHDASQSILYRNVAFPKYSRMRKMLIDHLSAYGLYQEKERLTAAVASRIIETYEIDAEKEDMDVLLSNHYTLTTYGGPVITCIAKLPAVEALDTLARIESKEKQKSLTWSRINMLRKLCQKIKKRNADVILAVIPQYNKAIYLNQNGRIDKHINNINPLCDTLLFFVKDTPEGACAAVRRAVKKIQVMRMAWIFLLDRSYWFACTESLVLVRLYWFVSTLPPTAWCSAPHHR